MPLPHNTRGGSPPKKLVDPAMVEYPLANFGVLKKIVSGSRLRKVQECIGQTVVVFILFFRTPVPADLSGDTSPREGHGSA